MFIRTIDNNYRYDYVKDFMLGDLIRSGKVIKFYRPSEGWITIGVDPVRSQTVTYKGTDRRKCFRRI